MNAMWKQCFILLLFPLLLLGREISTFYGTVEIQEPVLLELIDSPAFQRLKKVHQYGVSYYTTHKEEYTRYAHSLGVLVVLREKGASLEEQIAGLLHDISHTVFSHVGDWIFNKECRNEDYQNSIHIDFLCRYGLDAILQKHGYKAAQFSPTKELYPALEQPLPNLCADRIDYNIQGAFYQGFITKEEGLEILHSLTFSDGRWISSKSLLMEKIARYSIFMSEDCWSSPVNYLSSRWLADAILRAKEIGLLTNEQIHFGTDDQVWQLLLASNDPLIRQKMEKAMHTRLYFTLSSPQEADQILPVKFRGIDPWIATEKGVVRLTSLNPSLHRETQEARSREKKGIAIKLLSNPPKKDHEKN